MCIVGIIIFFSILTMFAYSCCVVSSRADKRAEYFVYNSKEDDNDDE